MTMKTGSIKQWVTLTSSTGVRLALWTCLKLKVFAISWVMLCSTQLPLCILLKISRLILFMKTSALPHLMVDMIWSREGVSWTQETQPLCFIEQVSEDIFTSLLALDMWSLTISSFYHKRTWISLIKVLNKHLNFITLHKIPIFNKSLHSYPQVKIN